MPDAPAPRLSDAELEELRKRLLGLCVDWSGEQIADNSTPRIDVHCELLRKAADALAALKGERDAQDAAYVTLAMAAEDWQARALRARDLAVRADREGLVAVLKDAREYLIDDDHGPDRRSYHPCDGCELLARIDAALARKEADNG